MTPVMNHFNLLVQIKAVHIALRPSPCDSSKLCTLLINRMNDKSNIFMFIS